MNSKIEGSLVFTREETNNKREKRQKKKKPKETKQSKVIVVGGIGSS